MNIRRSWLIALWLTTLIVSAGLTYSIAKETNIISVSGPLPMIPGSPVSTTKLPSPTPKPEDFLDESYKAVTATIFWVGETADASNDFISNEKSAWDTRWQQHFGGVDNPYDRCGYYPCTFRPRENPFYIALPYNDLDGSGKRKTSARQIPWFAERQHFKSVVKNTWVEIKHFEHVCYAQWEDSGPNQYNDFAYVFGEAKPINTFGAKAGIDISPAVRDCLEMTSNGVVGWKFVNESEVPEGPWKEIVTTRDVTW